MVPALRTMASGARRTGRARRGRASRLSLLLAALVFLRALIPVGFMPQVAAGGGLIDIVICTGHGLRTLTILDPGGLAAPQPSNPDALESGLCPFAAAGALAFVGLIVALLWPVGRTLRSLLDPPSAFRPPAVGFGALGPRAPPLQA